MLLAAKIASLIGAAPQQRGYFWWCLILLISIAGLSLHPRGEGGSLTASGPLRTCLLKLLNFRSWAWRTSMIKNFCPTPCFLNQGKLFQDRHSLQRLGVDQDEGHIADLVRAVGPGLVGPPL